MNTRLLFIYCFFCWSTAAWTAEVTHAHIDHDDGHYLLNLVMKVEAEMETVYAILTDFDNIHKLNNAIKHSKLLKSEGKRHLIRIEAEGCVWFFCQKVFQTQWVTEQGNGYISAVTLPEKSNLEYGRVLWHIRQQGDVTVINYRTDIIPKFFVPPVIGTYIMKNKMLEEAKQTIQTIERIAQDNENY